MLDRRGEKYPKSGKFDRVRTVELCGEVGDATDAESVVLFELRDGSMGVAGLDSCWMLVDGVAVSVELESWPCVVVAEVIDVSTSKSVLSLSTSSNTYCEGSTSSSVSAKSASNRSLAVDIGYLHLYRRGKM